MYRNKLSLRMLLMLLLEIAIPIFSTLVFPHFFPDTSSLEFCIAAMCVSIFIAIWDLKSISTKDHVELLNHRYSSRHAFNQMHLRMDSIEKIIQIIGKFDNNVHPYFQSVLHQELTNYLIKFEDDKRELLEGYVETSPYAEYTFGINGLRWTKKEICAVSSIQDYWERSEFVERYLSVQFDLIKDRNVQIERIFIVTNDTLPKVQLYMKFQKENGIHVYYMNRDDSFFASTWGMQDFLIQDQEILVDMQAVTHRPDEKSKEIITTKRTLVDRKMILFEQMRNNAVEF